MSRVLTDAVDLDLVPAPVQKICRELKAQGHEAYLVGGAVRDLVLGRPVADWDVATSALPQQVQQLFKRTVPTGVKHGTVTVLWGKRSVEVTTFRVEGNYGDGRRPDRVEFVSSLRADLERRDFTINALALDVGKEGARQAKLVDPLGGLTDLDKGLIRAVGSPTKRLQEDALRALRALRFAAVLGFSVDPATLKAIPLVRDQFAAVSAERVRDELLKMLAATRPSLGTALLKESGLLIWVLPELSQSEPDYSQALLRCDATQGDALLRLIALVMNGDGVGEALAERLRLSKAERTRICQLMRYQRFERRLKSDADLRRFLAGLGREYIVDFFALRRAYWATLATKEARQNLARVEELHRRVEQILRQNHPLALEDLAVDGKMLMRHLEQGPGPWLGDLLKDLLNAVLEDPRKNESDSLLQMAERLNPQRGASCGKQTV